MADVFRHQGLDLSEPMCFGLGSGLHLIYLRDFGVPSRVIHGRGLAMEADLCAAVGAAMRSVTEADPEAAWRKVRAAVDAGRAVVLQCDVRMLPHYKSQLPFNGHRVVLAGYDPADETALVADTHFEGLLPVPQAELRASRASDGPPAGYSANLWWEIDAPHEPPDLPAAARRAMIRCGEQLLAPSERAGVGALARFAEEVGGWGALPDATLVAHFGYQVIERRGTGGSLFRKLYRDFLAEVARRWPDCARGLDELVLAAGESAAAWSELAGRFKRVPGRTPADFSPLAPIAEKLVALERALAERLVAA